ncbi:dihydrolipoamide acetyltransferase component of acetoin dehydrogenase complex [Liquorilactobacillus sucicola DSM 21376 = JCM 15457]|uniref:Dihydrolipoamide acetyltransferase component of pyruvate dehydrogenase complex n=1 Tax=Liquorilactobacillus sucicola DSM 21376 = JCM 15457 TaxID=1423806 RepID=A0A023CX12_9LACO|nr:dihydrolipoamide acetyltransferase family protein [Liquorilactobacillus sucicola]KRN06952.1 branched-chain alpha-keto acid dehydrogenase subunit E2 [Liquorilactobacillus sucicola DSM 21376 = JCM 15457]GAJ26433.1 dihydrolipoamide acetyltransferase component of acetoin dehydrogenase complex [Liquorilactobacillus sucicola DSM 21376 = JCM 15457]
MATEIIMPKLGLTMTEGTVYKWVKNEGDEVKKGDIVATINSEKLTADVDAPSDGTLIKILVPEGEDAKCKAPIGYIGAAGEAIGESKAVEAKAAQTAGQNETPQLEEEETVKTEAPQPHEQNHETDRIFITPLARKIAAEKGWDYRQIKGTGGNGRITKRDVENYTPAVQPVTPVATTVSAGAGLTGMRQIIAQRMMSSLQNTAQVTLQRKADITSLMAFREDMKQKVSQPLVDGQLSITTLVTKAAILALRKTPQMNAWYQAGKYEQVDSVNIGMAVALDDGLVVPVVKGADSMTLTELGRSLNTVISDAREGTLDGSAYSGGTFTISNLGRSGVEYFTPVINQPEIGILGVGTLLKELALRDDGSVKQIAKLPLSLTFDHQIIDGAPAADFLAEIVAHLEDPYTLII